MLEKVAVSIMEASSLDCVEYDPEPSRGVIEQQRIGPTRDRDPLERVRGSEQLQKGPVERTQTRSARQQQRPIDIEEKEF